MNFDRASVKRVWVPLVAGSIALGGVYKAGPGPHGIARDIGLALALVGFFGVLISRYTLGRSFSIRAKATALVTTGIYSRIRNPIYVSGIFFIGGALVMVWQLKYLAILLILIPVQILRACREAAVLEAKFGDEYRGYRSRTWF